MTRVICGFAFVRNVVFLNLYTYVFEIAIETRDPRDWGCLLI